MFGDGSKIPDQPPYVGRFNDLLTLKYQNIYYKYKMNLGWSGSLVPLLRFYDKNVYDTTSSLYKVIYPTQTLSTLTDVIEERQYTSTLYKLTNLSRIVLKSNSLANGSEYFINTENLAVSENVLQDFAIQTDSDLGTSLIYSIDTMPWRRFTLSKMSGTNLRNIDIEVSVKYDDESEKPLELQPGESFSCRLTFFEE